MYYIRPVLSLKLDCACAFQRKVDRVMPFDAEQSVLSSPLCGRTIAKYGHVLRISRQKAGHFLCILDWVAEREEFEPSVQVLARTTV
jgi:hypothetical protein